MKRGEWRAKSTKCNIGERVITKRGNCSENETVTNVVTQIINIREKNLRKETKIYSNYYIFICEEGKNFSWPFLNQMWNNIRYRSSANTYTQLPPRTQR